MDVMTAVIIVTVTGLLGSVILAVASQYLRVDVDERVSLLQEVLPGVNCGACGYAGCADYAVALVEGAAPNLCIPGGENTVGCIAKIMGVAAGNIAQKKAIVTCQGSLEHRSIKYKYSGIKSCAVSTALHGGNSSCPYGCLGYGDCVQACKFDAIEVKNGVAQVIMEKCTGCGACEDACPKKVILVREVSNKPVVMCANHQRGALTRKVCTTGCIACMKCEKICPEKAIKVNDNLAYIDQDKCTGCGACIQICPVNAIVEPKMM